MWASALPGSVLEVNKKNTRPAHGQGSKLRALFLVTSLVATSAHSQPLTVEVKEFNAANTDSDRMPVHVELVMVKTALEWLLGIDEKRVSLTKALLARFPKSAAATPHGPLMARWMQEKPTDDRLLAAWALDFCKVRNSAAHGSGQRGALRLVWNHDRHLAFASLLFPLVVKKVLGERAVYVPTARDRDEFNHIEDFLAIDPFGPEPLQGRSPWVEVQSKIRGLGLRRSLRGALLDRLGTHDLSTDSDHAH